MKVKKNFEDKKEIFEYIVNNFSKKNDLVLVAGSTANKPIKSFSDIDIEIYGKKRKPYYEIIFYHNKPVLLSIYFRNYKSGKECQPIRKVKVLKGKYTRETEEVFEKEFGVKGKYNKEQFARRNCQLVIDFFFKYLRSKDEKWLSRVQEKLLIE